MDNKINEIANWVEANSAEIINNIEQESVDVYCFLKKEFKKSNVNNNFLFQFVYRSFYRLDNAGLTTEFKKDYFKILEEHRNERLFDIERILYRLYSFPNRKGQNTVQFSFVTKMLNTINDSMPIYDSEVAKMFSLSRPYQKEIKVKVNRYLKQLKKIQNGYEQIIEQNLLPKTVKLFDETFICKSKLSNIKKLDFIFWSAGKMKTKINSGKGIHPNEELDEIKAKKIKSGKLFWNSFTNEWQDSALSAVEYYKTIGVDLKKIENSSTIGSFYLSDILWTKEELVEEYGKGILIEDK